MIPPHHPTPTGVLDLAPGTAMKELTGSTPPLRTVGAPNNPHLREMFAQVYRELAHAEKMGRATFTPTETALIVEIANRAFRAGVEVGAHPEPVMLPANLLPFPRG
jgi:hypothetical protein